jgi:hypothetical protein
MVERNLCDSGPSLHRYVRQLCYCNTKSTTLKLLLKYTLDPTNSLKFARLLLRLGLRLKPRWEAQRSSRSPSWLGRMHAPDSTLSTPKATRFPSASRTRCLPRIYVLSISHRINIESSIHHFNTTAAKNSHIIDMLHSRLNHAVTFGNSLLQ